MRRVLFICSHNKLRSPTAEQVFSSWSTLEVSSAGLKHDAENPVTPELLQWAELIFVMEKRHKAKLAEKFKAYCGHARIICLDIPDNYAFMDEALIALLHKKLTPYLR
jgi:predicted protein tyrosine phosphatase